MLSVAGVMLSVACVMLSVTGVMLSVAGVMLSVAKHLGAEVDEIFPSVARLPQDRSAPHNHMALQGNMRGIRGGHVAEIQCISQNLKASHNRI